MRCHYAGVALFLSVAQSAAGGEVVRWPDPSIQIPPRVRSFIAAECSEFAQQHETLAECRLGESYGHRAVVMLLSDPEIGEWAATRYRDCTKTVDRTGGRFHRNLADCISAPLGLRWRFEFSEHTRTMPGLPAARIAPLGASIAARPHTTGRLRTSVS